MGIMSSQNGNVSVNKGDIIFSEGQTTGSVNILAQGKTDVFCSLCDELSGMNEEEILKKSYKIFSIGQNLFIGTHDFFLSNRYTFSYKASEDSKVYVFQTNHTDDVLKLMDAKKEYGAYILTSVSSFINSSCLALLKISSHLKSLNILSDNLITFYWSLKEKYGFDCAASGKLFREGLENLQKMKEKNFAFPSLFHSEFLEKDYSDISGAEYESREARVDDVKLSYYRHLLNLSVDLRKSFFGADMTITGYHCTKASEFLNEIQNEIKDAFKTAESYLEILFSGEESIFSEYAKAALEMKHNQSDNFTLLQVLEYLVRKCKETVLMYESEYCHTVEIDVGDIERIYNQAKNGDNPGREAQSLSDGTIEIKEGAECIPEELEDAARKILEYSDIPKDRAELFWENLETFRNMRDKLSVEDEARSTRNAVASVFFEIYEGVFKKVYAEKNKTKLYQMFLKYAFMDEKLLKPEYTLSLYKIADKSFGSGQCSVYTMYEWLLKVYKKEKDPSINEFGMDYNDVFREMKRRNEISDKDKPEYDNNVNARLKHEIQNLFRINHKLCFGQTSIYFPILHNDMIPRDILKVLVTPEAVNASINKIREIDFSAFHREVSYRNVERGIEKEFIMKEVFPDIILMPTVGTRPIMWQELTGRDRSSPGRFLLPAFTSENLDEMILKMVGNFRWELCRTMMGVAWNDITEKSLTSEYSDYIQFYKKNKDLSEEAREKIKVQIQKYRNMLKEIFTSDYEIWINYESKGSVRLNKIVRNILYRYCPFVKPIREGLEKQPLYSEIASQFNIQRSRHAKELENHYNRLFKSGPPDEDCEQNLKFYKEM